MDGPNIQPVVRLADLTLTEQSHGTRFAAGMAQLAAAAGARKLGARLTEVPPGKAAWPFHCHHVNEEMFVVLAGRGTLRLGGARHPIAAGDVVVCPAGGPETAHQIVNDGTEALRGHFTVVTTDLTIHKSMPVPPDLRTALAGYARA